MRLLFSPVKPYSHTMSMCVSSARAEPIRQIASSFQIARNGACKMHTAPPQHPTQIVVPRQCMDPIPCGALKHATGVAPSSTPPWSGSSVISSVWLVCCSFLLAPASTKAYSEEAIWRTSFWGYYPTWGYYPLPRVG